ncbi:hypothetical protein F5Y13DRAFT_186271 [Hypoxylon sp. FL1857]|nr:hypothetical protein F5Y13DRAFT_186271 [Hypoxylon sp. FL1857]
MSLDILPNEILRDIFSRLDGNFLRRDHRQPDLCAVALTCRYISPVAIDLLYSRITLHLTDTNPKEISSVITLIHCLRANPILVDRIRALKIIYESGNCARLCNEFLSYLARSTSLVELKLGTLDRLDCPEALLGSVDGHFSHLKYLRLGSYRLYPLPNYISGNDLVKLCDLPALEVLNVSASIISFWKETLPTKTLHSLTKLHCYGDISVGALESILPRAPNLESLIFSIAGTKQERIIDREYQDEIMRPSFYANLLAPQATNLKALSISLSDVVYSSHDGSRFDLSSFTNLSLLDLDSQLLFGLAKTANDCPCAREIWRSLPPRLDKLSLRFTGRQGLFWSFRDMLSHEESGTFDLLWERRLHHDYIGWLLELLDQCRQHMIAVGEIVIIENQEKRRPAGKWKMVTWQMTDQLNEAARVAGVALKISLVVPLRFRNSEFHSSEAASYRVVSRGGVLGRVRQWLVQ